MEIVIVVSVEIPWHIILVWQQPTFYSSPRNFVRGSPLEYARATAQVRALQGQRAGPRRDAPQPDPDVAAVEPRRPEHHRLVLPALRDQLPDPAGKEGN